MDAGELGMLWSGFHALLRLVQGELSGSWAMDKELSALIRTRGLG